MSLVVDKTEFAENLLGWWNQHQRKFPWRSTQKPYPTLISEIMLHRTRASQVVPVYEEFIKKYPTIATLSEASMRDVNKMLHPLGLHWRAASLYKAVRRIVAEHNGKVPAEKEALVSLPGISHYIAAAIRCFAFGCPETLLDTNTVRVLGRVFGITTTDGSRRRKKFGELYQSLIDEKRSREFNYAMIDLGAKVCTPKSPSCKICPVFQLCKYGSGKAERQ
jgi:A/G-specific adenine glycosylase